MARPDRDYEHFVQRVYQTILAAEGKDTIKVEHDVRLEGVSGQKHQIDVYWEYKQGGITYYTAIECKFYKNPIEIGKVRDFYGVLADIPNLRGIMATARGYESGALRFARSKGIELQVIRAPEKSDYEWHDLHLKVKGHVARVFWNELSIIGDMAWRESAVFQPTEIKGNGSISEICIKDKLTGLVKNVDDISGELNVLSQSLVVGERYLRTFPDDDTHFRDMWIIFPKEVYAEPIKILQLKIPFVVEEGLWDVHLTRATEQDKTIIVNALQDKHKFYSESGRPTGGKGHIDDDLEVWGQ